MLRNIIDIDYAAHRVSERSRSGAILLFDFQAAFPSVAHEMIWETLLVSGIDPGFVRAIQSFYKEDRHILKVRGEFFPGMLVQSDVRQGCPLSPVLFALIMDPFIRKVNSMLLPTECILAYADDMAVIIDDWERPCGPSQAPAYLAIPRLFHFFGRISNLKVNSIKTLAPNNFRFTYLLKFEILQTT